MPTLLQVWPFERRLTMKDKEDLFRHFGAESIKHISKHGRHTAVLARFRKEEDCEFAMQSLHQQEVLGKRLIAVYQESLSPVKEQPHQEILSANKADVLAKTEMIKKKLIDFEEHLSAVSSHFNVKHPVPPQIKYIYPPPTASILANIVQTLVDVPNFYTQVLHLMNKMDLSVPFGNLKSFQPQHVEMLKLMDLYDEIDRTCSGVDAVLEKEDEEQSEDGESEIESELESDEEHNEKPNMHRLIKKRTRKSRTMMKRPNFALLKQTCLSHPRPSGASLDEVFENTDSCQSKKLKMKLTGTLPTEASASSFTEDIQADGFGKIEVKKKQKEEEDNPVEWKGEFTKYISKEELQNDRINQADWTILPVFKNYKQGDPSIKLYIKNLAKTTTEADLKYIFGRYVFWHNEEEASAFSVRLMKEGRMKGQAFVTFESVKQATEALNDTNGYILNDKPMVVAFGKVKS